MNSNFQDGSALARLRVFVFLFAFLAVLVVTGVASTLVYKNSLPGRTETMTMTGSRAAFPAVAAHVPSADAADIPVGQKLTIVFDHPMVALTQVQGEAAAGLFSDWPVTIEPALRGEWRWISTYAVQFTPKSGLVPGTLYTVTVPAGMTSVAGGKTETSVTWRFETERPAVVSTEPGDGDALAGPTTPIVLHFNQEIDPASVGKHLSLVRVSGSGASAASTGALIGDPVAIRALKIGTMDVDKKKVSDPRALIVLPSDPLRLSSSYVLRLTAGTLGKRGDLGTQKNVDVHFSTVEAFKAQSWKYEYGGVTIHFNNPLADEKVKQFIDVSPVPDGWKDIAIDMNSWLDSQDIYFSPTLAPSTLYTFTVKKGIADRFGQTLEEPYVFTIHTPPTSPEVALAHSKGEFGIFERSKPPVYYINGVNVSKIEVEFAKLTLDEFISIRSQKQAGNWNLVPNLKGKNLHTTWTITPKKRLENQWETTTFDIEKRVGASLSSGIYALVLRAPEFKNPMTGEALNVQQYFALTNTALTLKYSGDHALVWATDMQTGEPVKDAKIQLHSLWSKATVEGKTDAKGFFDTAISIGDFTNQSYEWEPEFWVTSEKNGDFAFVSSRWNGGIQASEFSLWTDFHAAQSPPFRLMSTITTDRPLYRPGDTVEFKGVVRLKDWDGKLQLPGSARTAQLTIQDPQGTDVMKKTFPFTEFGGFSGSFAVGDAAPLGYYSFSLQLLPETDVPYPSWSGGFSVLAYRKPEYRVELTASQDDLLAGDTVDIDLAGSYYFGAPLANAPVIWGASVTDYFFNTYTDGWYSFALEDDWCWRNCNRMTTMFTEGTGSLDDSGHMRIRFPVSIDDKPVSQILTVEADVSDPNNQLVSNRVSIPVHKSRVYVGVRTEDYVVTPGDRATIGVVTLDPQGKPAPKQSVTLKLFSRTWNSVKKKGVDGEFYYDNQPVDTFISQETLTTGTDGKGKATPLIANGGQFRIIAEVTDADGHTAKAGTSVYAWSSTYFNWPHQNNERIDVIADKPEYAVGDTAKLLVKSPFQGKGVKALVTVERENVLTKTIMDVTSNALPIEVPITEDYVPNVFVSVIIIKPRVGETFDDQGIDTGVPAFRIGYARLNVETKRKRLTVSVSTDKEKYLPGQNVTATVKAHDVTGKPVAAEFSLATVDQSVLDLAAFDIPDLVASFYAEHGLGVNTAELLTYLVERFKPGSKGGGGGDLSDRKRGEFKDTAYWNPNVRTDAKGEATVTFTLPQNLTTWQLLAIGSTKDSRFGAAKKDVVATKNVIVRPVRPRFAVRGDDITLGALVHNFLPTTQEFTVTLSGSGFTSKGKMTQRVSIAPDQQKKVSFPVHIESVDQLTLDFTAETKGARDEIEEKIPVYIYGTPQSVATTGRTDGVVTEKVLVPSEKDASDGSLSITVSPSLASYLSGGLEYVLNYPYWCVEQAVSAILPQIAVKRLQGFDAFKIIDDRALDARVTSTLQQLYTAQRGDGGFGYWAESPESYPALTSYVTYAMTLAKDTGYSVDERALSRAGDYLQAILRDKTKGKTPLDLATRANILYVLSEIGRGDANLLSALDESSDKLPVFARAELAMALQKAGKTRRAKALLTHILDTEVKIDPRGAHVEEADSKTYRVLMQTNTQTTAEVLKAMIRIDPGNALVLPFTRFLLASRKEGHWDTTQSTVQTILSFVEYLKSTSELDANELAGVDVNGAMRLTERFSGINILSRKEVTLALDELLRGQENTIKIGKDGKGTLFYDMLLSYFYTSDTLPALDQGMAITRDLRSIEKKNSRALATAKLGDTYSVTLTMTVPEDRYFVAVESPLPSGMEALDLQLQTVKQTGLPEEVQNQQSPSWWWMDDGTDDGLWRFTHKEFRDDRVFLFADYLPAGVYQYTYLVRATTPGTFHERPAKMWEMYFPENFGQTQGRVFTVTE